eukprot:CAMPEP_0184859484 /NCGR_PEP_ID=MMETSP0580-20130426/4472_1 /TAXON_ID=1118495 /ORGANISM="Dactyliosolen fragilissimus" /LENGTH=495 /DNA_ID=CAMNT_0027356125 /DNA_START=62 /DNA_END=1546 /DNA_ORIENTATION=+
MVNEREVDVENATKSSSDKESNTGSNENGGKKALTIEEIVAAASSAVAAALASSPLNSNKSDQTKSGKETLTIDTTESPSFGDSQTPRTVATTPPGKALSPGSPGSPPPSTVLVKTKAQRSDGGVISCCVRHRKPIIIILLFYGLLVSGFGAYFFRSFFRIPGLQTQIDDLKFENDRLEKEVDTLTFEVDRLSGLIVELGGEIDQLNETNTRLEANIFDLKTENNVTKELLEDFKETNDAYEENNDELKDINGKFELNNKNLKSNIQDLRHELNVLHDNNLNLTNSSETYKNLTILLQTEVENLDTIAANLNITLDDFQAQNNILGESINRLDKQNKELKTIVTFFNDTVTEINQDKFDDLIEQLATDIEFKWNLEVERLHTNYNIRLADWDCDFSKRFQLAPFGQDQTVSFGTSDFYEKVISYIDDRLLNNLCVDLPDFQEYLKNEKTVLTAGGNLWDLNMDYMKEGVSEYVEDLLDYYFPDFNESHGLNTTEW